MRRPVEDTIGQCIDVLMSLPSFVASIVKTRHLRLEFVCESLQHLSSDGFTSRVLTVSDCPFSDRRHRISGPLTPSDPNSFHNLRPHL